MVSNVHYIELYINKQLIELESQESLNLRINNVLFNPTRTTTTQAEYSYSFEIPSTPNNDRILGYANNLSKTNKFHARYPSEVYADGNLIFDGTLTIQKYSSKDKMYTCNLVNIKVKTLEEIFGDMVMTDIHWDVPFDGAPTINSVNADMSTKYFFPLVSYGVFQKDYVTKDEVGATYTPKHNLDKYNKWWVESFYPSLNMLETMRKAFESKGYGVGGGAYADPFLNNIYCSTNLASEQTPTYNLGNPKFGECNIHLTWNNYQSINQNVGFRPSEGFTNLTGGIPQDLKYPYYRVDAAVNSSSVGLTEYNLSTIMMWNMLDSKNNSAVTVDIQNDTYMYDPNEHLIVIPSDGWYKIVLNTAVSLSGVNTTFTSKQYTTTYYDGDALEKRDVVITRELKEQCPIEIQLIRNYDENIELIKGRKNVKWKTGDPNQTEYTYRGDGYTGGTYPNRSDWETDFPHQNLYGASNPTNDSLDSTVPTRQEKRGGGYVNGTENKGGTFGGNRISVTISNNSKVALNQTNSQGYMHREGFVMPYDQVVSEAFICGFSSLGNGTVSVMRNGMSWSKLTGVNNRIFADVKGLDVVNMNGDGTSTVATNYCANQYKGSRNSCRVTDSQMDGTVSCCVYLNKNDILELVAIQRDFDEGQMYATSGNCQLYITAMNNESETVLRGDPTWSIESVSTFPTQLNLFNFTNKETKVSDWIQNIQKAFNLEITQNGNYIDISTNQGLKKNITNAVDIDNRVNSDEAESEFISYPREMSVQYKINTDEWGFELTVPPEHINDEDWAKWGDSGFTIIQLNDDSYESSTQNTTTNFSYTYYDNFNFRQQYQNGQEASATTQITIPVLEKSEYMAEGYGYEEAMKHDGYSLTQRFWYRPQTSSQYVWLSSVLASGQKEAIDLVYPKNTWERFNLSYKDTEKSIVSEYFNIHPMLNSNYVKVDCYLTPDEYKQIKGGALVHLDSDLYYTAELSGYDPSGTNPTELKLIKRV